MFLILNNFNGKQLTNCEIASEINSDNNNGVEIDCDDVVGKSYYAKGGKVNIDYFEEYELLENEYPKIYDVVFEQGELTDYKDTEKLLNKLNSILKESKDDNLSIKLVEVKNEISGLDVTKKSYIKVRSLLEDLN